MHRFPLSFTPPQIQGGKRGVPGPPCCCGGFTLYKGNPEHWDQERKIGANTINTRSWWHELRWEMRSLAQLPGRIVPAL